MSSLKRVFTLRLKDEYCNLYIEIIKNVDCVIFDCGLLLYLV